MKILGCFGLFLLPSLAFTPQGNYIHRSQALGLRRRPICFLEPDDRDAEVKSPRFITQALEEIEQAEKRLEKRIDKAKLELQELLDQAVKSEREVEDKVMASAESALERGMGAARELLEKEKELLKGMDKDILKKQVESVEKQIELARVESEKRLAVVTSEAKLALDKGRERAMAVIQAERELEKELEKRVRQGAERGEEIVRETAVTAIEAGIGAATGDQSIYERDDKDERFSVTTYYNVEVLRMRRHSFPISNFTHSLGLNSLYNSLTTIYPSRWRIWPTIPNCQLGAEEAPCLRFITYTSLGAAIALGGNLFGVTSALLSLAPGEAAKLELDQLYPVNGFKRCSVSTSGYTFVYPVAWVADQSVALRQQRAGVKDLDPPSLAELKRRRQQSVGPEVAFGPPGRGGPERENVSVVKQALMPGFSLRGSLGDPWEAAEKLLNTAIAPPASGKEWELVDAFEEQRGPSSVYQFEYIVEKPGRFKLHNLSVITSRGDELITLTVIAPATVWDRPKERDQLKRVAASFHLTK